MARRRMKATPIELASGCVVLLVICLCASMAGWLMGRSSTSTTASTSASHPTAATDTPRPTATPLPLDTGTYLGALKDVFVPLVHQDPSRTPTNAVVAGHHVAAAFWLTLGTDGQDRVREIDVSALSDAPDGPQWDDQTAAAIVATFLPPDAKHLRDVTTHVNTWDTVVHHVFTSALLAQAIQPSDFVDDFDLTTQLPPGTFEWYCWSHRGASVAPYDGCTIWTWSPK